MTDFSKIFILHMDVSDYQLGFVITHEGNHVVLFSSKLNKAQRNYNTTEKYALSIVETLK